MKETLGRDDASDLRESTRDTAMTSPFPPCDRTTEWRDGGGYPGGADSPGRDVGAGHVTVGSAIAKEGAMASVTVATPTPRVDSSMGDELREALKHLSDLGNDSHLTPSALLIAPEEVGQQSCQHLTHNLLDLLRHP